LLAELRAGNPQSPETNYGPLVSKAQFDKVVGYIEKATATPGARAYGGQVILEDTGGYFIEPALLVDLSPDSAAVREEIFGPVVTLLSFSDEDEAIRLANDTVYGLAAYVWTTKMARGFRLANAMDTAMTVVNAGAIASSGPGHAYSGEPARMSGIGVEGGVAGLEAYQRCQTIWINHG
jgi:acyl-CoA reductase-like NAD-dependent aldehyde dehydrogenase